MAYQLVQKMRGWLAIRPNGENDVFFYDHAEALAYVEKMNSGLEIERRWLVTGPIPTLSDPEAVLIHQSYLAQPEGSNTVVRIREVRSYDHSTFYLTVKEEVSHGVCKEGETEIPELVYRAFANMTVSRLTKQRWSIPHGDHTIHLDRICVKDGSIWIAEIELPSIDTVVVIPEWFGEEITGRREYSNFALAKQEK